MTSFLDAILDWLIDCYETVAMRWETRSCCPYCARSTCSGHDCAAIVAEGQRIRAMMREVDAQRAAERQDAALAPWERYINELAAQGKL